MPLYCGGVELPEGEHREEIYYEEWYGKYVEGREQPQLTDNHMVQKRITKFCAQYIAGNTKLVDNRPALIPLLFCITNT